MSFVDILLTKIFLTFTPFWDAQITKIEDLGSVETFTKPGKYLGFIEVSTFFMKTDVDEILGPSGMLLGLYLEHFGRFLGILVDPWFHVGRLGFPRVP